MSEIDENPERDDGGGKIPDDPSANAGVFRIDCDRDDFIDLMTWKDVDGNSVSFTSMDRLDVNSANFKNIMTALRCAFCGVLCPAPAGCYMCDEGHLACSNCAENFYVLWKKEGDCPYVRESDDSTSGRCEEQTWPLNVNLYAHLHDSYKTIGCPFKELGCELEIETDQVDRHELLCPFNPKIGCPYLDCEEGEMHCGALVNHLTKSHGAVLVDLDKEISEEFVPVTLKGLFRDAEYVWIPIIYKYLGVHFLFTLNLTNGKLSMWLDSLEKPMLELEPEMKFKKDLVEGKTRKSWVWAPVPAVFAEYGVDLKKDRKGCVKEASLADLERKSVLTFDGTNGKMNVHLIF